MLSSKRVPFWVVATIAGLGVIAGWFFLQAGLTYDMVGTPLPNGHSPTAKQEPPYVGDR